MIATLPIKCFTLVTLTPLILTRPGPRYDITFPLCGSDQKAHHCFALQSASVARPYSEFLSAISRREQAKLIPMERTTL